MHALLLCLALLQSQATPDAPRPEPRQLELASPNPAARALFGYSVAGLDFDGDGVQDIAVGAPGESAVYVFLGPEFARSRRFAPIDAQPEARFGVDLAAGPLDEEPGDELVVGAKSHSTRNAKGAGRVYVISQGRPQPVGLSIPPEENAALGNCVAVADLDGDGALDVAAGAPKARVGGEPSGAVLVHSLKKRETWRLENPLGAWKHGNYGHDLASADANGDGQSDLFVSAVGNRSAAGVRGAGQVYVHLNPLPEGEMIVVEDPAPDATDGARFGMSIFARDLDGDGRAELLVGAPRKNGGGVEDAGLGIVFHGPELAARNRTFLHPRAKADDVLGFRALIADVVGDPTRDVILATLARDNPKALVVWDGARLDDDRGLVLPCPPGGSHHFVQGLALLAAGAENHEALVLGDPNFDPGQRPDAGRVVVWRFEAQ